MQRPLSGTTILEAVSADAPLAVRLAAALCGRLGADLGAIVLKFEPQGGDPVRRIEPLVGGTSALFAFTNAGKKSVAIAEENREAVLRRLAGKADVAILDEPLAAALGRDALPSIAVLYSMFGDAAGAPAKGSEFTVAALSGLLDLVGDDARQPLRLGGHQPAFAAGLAGFCAVSAALCAEGAARQTIDVSLLETSVWLNWKTLAVVATGTGQPKRSGSASEWRVVRCADGWVAFVYQARDWEGLKAMIGDPRLDDERFATVRGRIVHTVDLVKIVEEAFAHRSRAEIRAESLKHRLPIGPVWDLKELAADPQNVSRRLVQIAEVGGVGAPMPRIPILWSGHDFPPGDVPAFGTTAIEAALP